MRLEIYLLCRILFLFEYRLEGRRCGGCGGESGEIVVIDGCDGWVQCGGGVNGCGSDVCDGCV